MWCGMVWSERSIITQSNHFKSVYILSSIVNSHFWCLNWASIFQSLLSTQNNGIGAKLVDATLFHSKFRYFEKNKVLVIWLLITDYRTKECNDRIHKIMKIKVSSKEYVRKYRNEESLVYTHTHIHSHTYTHMNKLSHVQMVTL